MPIRLTVIKGPHQEREFVFEEYDNFIVGRAKFARFQLSMKDGYISRVHFLVEVNPPRCRLMDMGSTNGTLVNREKVPAADLKDGDLIGVGKGTVIRVSLQETGPPTAPQVPAPLAAVFEEQTMAPPTAILRRAEAAPSRASPSAPTPPESTLTFHPGAPCPSCALPMAAGAPLTPSPLAHLCPACQKTQLVQLASSIARASSAD